MTQSGPTDVSNVLQSGKNDNASVTQSSDGDNSSTGDGGCVPRGGSKGLPCGTWSWSSRGKGTLKPPNNGIPLTDFDWITVNDDGSCDLGYF